MKSRKTEDSPLKSVLTEIAAFRKLLRKTASAYVDRLDGEIEAASLKLEKEGAAEELSSSHLRDLRDILTMLRTTDVKPEKGRRKDLKKLDTTVSDLTMLTEKW